MSPGQRSLRGYLHQVVCHLLVQVSSQALDPVVLLHEALGGVITQVDVNCSQTMGRSWAGNNLYNVLLGDTQADMSQDCDRQ